MKPELVCAEQSKKVYIYQQDMFEDSGNSGNVYQSYKALYGLKRDLLEFYQCLKTFSEGTGFVESLADASLFVLREAEES